jgi:transcriptional regulator with XRE-family HTH domain
MKTNRKKMISELVKEGRVAKGYTQKELSELTNISVRSIQRIENAEILPRSYTLKTLSETLGIPFESFRSAEPGQHRTYKINKSQKIILSIGMPVFVLLLSWAFLAQSAKFPETAFELLIFVAIVLLVLTTILFLLWRARS